MLYSAWPVVLLNISLSFSFSIYLSFPAFLPSPSGGCGAGSHDPEEGVDVIALDGVSTGGDHLVLGLTHCREKGVGTFRLWRVKRNSIEDSFPPSAPLSKKWSQESNHANTKQSKHIWIQDVNNTHIHKYKWSQSGTSFHSYTETHRGLPRSLPARCIAWLTDLRQASRALWLLERILYSLIRSLFRSYSSL